MDEVSTLVSPEGHRVSRRVFSSRAIYDREKTHIFGRNWLYLCHASQLRNIGDFVHTWMCETPVIVARGDDGKIHASVNSCVHRGVKVCRADEGNAKRFICPYHGWAYKVSGELVATPQDKLLVNSIEKSERGLVPVPRLDSYEGLIFGSFNRDIESLDAALGDMKFYLDTYFKRFDGGVDVIGPAHKWQLKANWKLPVENQLGDVAHGPLLHGSLLSDPAITDDLDTFGVNMVPKPGHGAATRLYPEGTAADTMMWGTEGFYAGDPEVQEFCRETQAYADEALGLGARCKGLTFGVYPNLSFLWANSTLRVSHPRGPGEIEYWSWWVLPSKAPESIRTKLRDFYSFMFGPAGVLEQEDAEAWSQQYQGTTLDFIDDQSLFYDTGLGEEWRHEELPGLAGKTVNELYARGFYTRWREDMLRD